ncbi:aliphatic sulfonate ABC transporter substrate-binding protein [Pseudobacillus sp. FSL P4-0506]|uniref:ABC transporter substrate-binding protein n=1 Tax=unclassified Pseudobacillus TaxID=2619284 RepID=UPI0030F5CA2F
MKKYSNYWLAVLFFIVSAASLLGCSLASGSNLTKKNEPTEVNVAINGGLNPLIIGREKGWFEEEFAKYNVKVKWSEFPSGPPLLESLASNRVDLSFLGDGALIAGLEKKLPFEVIGQTGTGESAVRIIVPTNGKVEKIEDLKGKRIGVAAGTTGHVYLIKALKNHGLSINDVKIINLQPDDAQAAFETKQLDAWATWNPYITNNVDKGTAIELKVNGKILAPGGIIARTDFGKKHPDIVEAYLRIYKKAADWQIENPDKAAEIYSAETKLPVETVKKIITAEPPNMFYTEQGIKAQQDSIKTLAKVGYIKREFQFKDHINNKYINAAFKK